MISVNTLKEAIKDSQQLKLETLVPRHSYLNWLEKASKNTLIKAITGFRRSGKSYLLKMLSQKLIQGGVHPKNIFFLNFENDLIFNKIKDVKDLRKAWDLYLKNIADLKKPIYIFWDEIQLVKNWEKLVRTLYEQGIYNIHISGSNSQLLSGELSSSLSGRCLTLEVLPFSFKEYLRYKKINPDYWKEDKELIDQALLEYLKRGGIAEQFVLKEELSANYKDGLIQKIVLDDIIKRYQIDKINVLMEVFEFVKGNITSTLSLRKIMQRLNEQSIEITVETLDNYLHYWQTSYAIGNLSRFDYKLSRIFDKTRKYYVIDNLLIPGREENDEKRLENLIYIELIRRFGQKKVFFAKDLNGYEVDFLVDEDDKKTAYQVCMNLNDDNAKREFGNLKLVEKYLQNTNGYVLYLNDHRLNFGQQNAISVVEWLLE